MFLDAFMDVFLLGNVAGSAVIVDDAALSGITKTLTDNVAKILPWGLGVLAIFIGVRQLPNLIKMFSRG